MASPSRFAGSSPLPRPAHRPHELNVSLATLHNWQRRGWVHGRQLTGLQGRWILWADEEEPTRLKSLRSSVRGWYNKPLSAELTKPKLR